MMTKDFDPSTMIRATKEDVERMYTRLWGWSAIIEFLAKRNPDIEYLDLTQEATNDYSELHPATTSTQLPSLHTGNGDEDL